jgi:hypothetical protein
MHHMVVMTVRAKDLDVDVPVLVNLPIRCMWGGQPDRWFVGGLTCLTTWVWPYGLLLGKMLVTGGSGMWCTSLAPTNITQNQ